MKTVRIFVALLCGVVIGLLNYSSARAEPTGAEPIRQLIRVGADQAIKTLADASKLAATGALIEVDAGKYAGDVAVWVQDKLTLRAMGGRVKLVASGAAAEGKAIWVVRAKGMIVEGFDFEGTAVPDRNGAGIRLESGSLYVKNCSFKHNEIGLLTSNDPTAVLEVEGSEFAYNQRLGDHNHNLYVGRIARLSVVNSYFHHARTGHLIKSRAALNFITDNNLTDEPGGKASYELEFPDGGVAYVGRNLISQSLDTENQKMISFGAEGYKWARNEIHLDDNTLVNPLRFSGIFLWVRPGANAISAINNRLVGRGKLELAGPGEYRNNTIINPRDHAPSIHRAAHNSDLMLQMRPPPN